MHLVVPERAILVGLELRGRGGGVRSLNPGGKNARTPEESIAELATLAQSAGATVVHTTIQRRTAPDAATLVGAGKVDELAREASASQAEVVIFDHDLTPTQQRNLENSISCKVVDRTQLILDIFARRARTREGQLQVELAQLSYLLPRLTGRGVEMSRLGGGIGTRGPGETKLETDRRRISRRIKKMRESLASVRASRSVQRRQRQAVPLATLALVGYTNAGKSTLFNRLTGEQVLADARLFATLDPTIRSVVLPSHRRVLLSDTVGFIDNLPTTLVQAFRATLEEVTEAALLVHVVDASSPEAALHTSHVAKVLSEIGVHNTPQLLVLNKTDLLPDEQSRVDAEAFHQRVAAHTGDPLNARVVPVSARTGDGLERLLAIIDEMLPVDPVSEATFRFPVGDTSKLHLLHELGRVEKTRYSNEYTEVEAQVSASLKRRLTRYLVRS